MVSFEIQTADMHTPPNRVMSCPSGKRHFLPLSSVSHITELRDDTQRPDKTGEIDLKIKNRMFSQPTSGTLRGRKSVGSTESTSHINSVCKCI